MKINELAVSKNKRPNRVGRGIAHGQGKTAGRGTKGQGARKSGGVRPGFEGGQTPLMMRIPKLRGFTSKRVKVQEVYTSQLEKLGLKSVDTIVLAEKGLVTTAHNPVKLLFDGEVTKPMAVKLQSASAAAKATLQKAGGSFERIPRLKHTSIKEK